MNESIKSYVKKFRLTDDQSTIYEWLREQHINTDDNTLCFWAKTYTSTRIREVVEFAHSRRVSGQKISNIGGWINKFLRSGNAVANEISKTNQNRAVEFARIKQWMDVKIYEKYIKDTVTGDDLPLTMETEEFIRCLEKLHQKSQLYKD